MDEVAKDLHNFGGPCCWECRYCIMIRGKEYYIARALRKDFFDKKGIPDPYEED